MAKSEGYTTTVIIRRPARVSIDDRGHNVWTAPIEETELELMTTQELKLALAAADDADRQAMQAMAESGKRGIVARNPVTGALDVVSDDELRELQRDKTVRLPQLLDTDSAPETGDDGHELSLVSTQMLKQMLGNEEPKGPGEPEEIAEAKKGFNPYDHS
ncbi:MAG: hypothetical protein WB812_09865 [Woeseiaceae bacterium]